MATSDKGWLVVNSFIESEKFHDLYDLLLQAAHESDVELELLRAAELPLTVPALRKLAPRFAIFWDKDVVFARALEMLGTRLFNPAAAIETCDSKALTAIALANAGVPTPTTVFSPMTFSNLPYPDSDFAMQAAQDIGYPLVVKENYGSFGAGVHLVRDPRALRTLIREFDTKGFVLQEYIQEASGNDIRVNVVGDEVVAALHRFSTNGDFRSNLTLGGASEPCAITEFEKKISLDACRALGLDFAGVDILRTESTAYVCEVNSNPHFRTTLDCTGVNMAEKIMAYLKEQLCL